MDLVVIVEPSDGAYPGHMVVGQEGDNESRFFGFHMDAALIPDEYRTPDRWQEFFYSHKIPGEIREESSHVERIRREKAKKLCEKRIPCETPIETVLPPPATWKHCASYSFRPDDFHSDADPCYNCVTWATMIADKLVPGFIRPVRQGRIKLIAQQLKGRSRRKGKKDG
jgi:hypothetical protein